MATTIYTLGDSTIDNLYWRLLDNDETAPEETCVEGLLKEKGHQVESHAYDGFTTKSVLGQDHIGAVLPRGSAYAVYMQKKCGNSPLVSPLKELEHSISQAPEGAQKYIVLSVGGNDFRENLANPWKLLTEIPEIQNRHLQIVDRLKGLEEHNVKPILMLQYRTDANNDAYGIYTIFGVLGALAAAVHLTSIALLTAPVWAAAGSISMLTSAILAVMGAGALYLSHKVVPLSVTKNILLCKGFGMSMLSGMIERFYQPILNKAKEERIPLLDLPNTFNPHKPLYDHGIEPSAEGGRLIAEGIDHIVRNHDFSSGSAFYAKRDGEAEYNATPNDDPSTWSIGSK